MGDIQTQLEVNTTTQDPRSCEACGQDDMAYQYDVTERDTQFVLWECGGCGHKYLERRPLSGEVAGLPAKKKGGLKASALLAAVQAAN